MEINNIYGNMEINSYYNELNNWLLIENRAFDKEGNMIDSYLEILDLNDLSISHCIEDVWIYDWVIIKSSTNVDNSLLFDKLINSLKRRV